MNVKRLTKLADYLDTVPRNRFNLKTWAEEHSCGTVACALGHAGLIPSFRRAGLKTKPDDFGGYVSFNDKISERAGAEFFDLTEQEAMYLFMPWRYPQGRRGPKSVAARIRKMIKKGGI